MLDTKKEAFAILVAGGVKPRDAAIHTDVDVSTATAYKWLKTAEVKALIQEQLQHNRVRIQGRVTQHIDAAITTIVNALDSPMMTPTQLNAAKILLSLASGGEATEDKTVNLIVELGTTLPDTLVEQQHSRSRKLSNSIDVRFKETNDADEN